MATRNTKQNVFCSECSTLLTTDGLESSLLSNPHIHLISTNKISLKINSAYGPYMAKNCECVVKDVGCVKCGNIVGYQIIQPCDPCLKSNNNGHLWMFYSDSIHVEANKSLENEFIKKEDVER